MRCRLLSTVLTVVVPLAALAGCATQPTEAVSQEPNLTNYVNQPSSTDLSCREAGAAVNDAAPDDSAKSDQIYLTLLACESVDAWITTMAENPTAFGSSGVSRESLEMRLQSACAGAEETPVCADLARLYTE
ncbi:hypothetical protein GCM10025738_19640 [Microbacterium fluvii]